MESGTRPEEQGRYLYCVAEAPEKPVKLGKIGIEKSEVYTLSAGELCAVVHNCTTEPYDSTDETRVKQWVKSHQGVIDKAEEKLGTIIPFSFDVIIKGEDADKEVLDWLRAEEEELKRKLTRLKGKQEFGVQVFFDKKLLAEEVMKENRLIQKQKEELKKLSKGKAYFHEQKLKELLKKAMEMKANSYFKRFYSQVKEHTDDIKVEKIKTDDMLMNLSCLVEKKKIKELGSALDTINRPPFSVKFTGPWPAYSFVC